MRYFKVGLSIWMLWIALYSSALDHKDIISAGVSDAGFTLISESAPTSIYIDGKDDKGVKIAASNLAVDFKRVCGVEASIDSVVMGNKKSLIIVGTIGTPVIDKLIADGKLDWSELADKREKYVMTTVANPIDCVDEALVIAGSDRRGTIYGVYELSEQIGVSPWYDWADVPVVHRDNLSIKRGSYTAGEPAVTYRGIFLNDEAPCLTGWVKNTYGTDCGDHNFYGRVFELILRLRGNFLWPAMWSWAFYADDPENSRVADEMGVIIGTSHHEPMARNHQEWARKRKDNGPWNYKTNKRVIDHFFADGIKRMRNTEDVVTIGMRGDGDEAMSADADVKLLEKIIKNQREIISRETGRPASSTPQVWALYKEVLDYYDAGMRVPDDVTILLCDDNWGNVRRLPTEEERKHPGGWGMYYHVDYVGAPRNSKLLNCTPVQNMWEQLQLTYDYGVDRLWILNVGDLKPMEYPITLFLDMAWNPTRYNASDILDHTRDFFAQQLGDAQAVEAARIFNLLCKYNGRVTPEMLDCNTYMLSSGEWHCVAGEYARLEAEALRQYLSLAPEYRDTYKQVILFPTQLMGNLYDMYYAQAMNHELYHRGMPEANEWAERTEKCFARDAALMNDYNKVMSNGKWDGMMTQKHIGYTSWNDDFKSDTLPAVYRIETAGMTDGGYEFDFAEDCVVIEAEHYNKAINSRSNGKWCHLPYVGRTNGAMAVMPYTEPVDGARLDYSLIVPAGVDSVDVHVVVKSTLAFIRPEGHRYTVSIDGSATVEVNFNDNLNESPDNIYSVFYPTVARRVVEKTVRICVAPQSTPRKVSLSLSPLDPGIVFEKIVVDFGGYKPEYLFGKETPCRKSK